MPEQRRDRAQVADEQLHLAVARLVVGRAEDRRRMHLAITFSASS